MKPVFLFISSCIAFVSPIVYGRAIVRGEAKPHRTTRFVLLVISILATASLFAEHNSVAIYLAGIAAIQAVFLFILSFRYGMGGVAKLDILCLFIALFGIILWQTTKNPVLALYTSITADFTGMIPALIKTHRLPETEIWLFYAMDVAAAFLSLLAIVSWTPKEFAYPLYIMCINGLMVFLIVRKRIWRRA